MKRYKYYIRSLKRHIINEYPKEIHDKNGNIVREGDSIFIFTYNRRKFRNHGVVFCIEPDNESINVFVRTDDNRIIKVDYPYDNFCFIKDEN